MQYTTYYAMKKPEDTDNVNISDIDDNIDTIDGQLHEMSLEIAGISSDATTVSENVETISEIITALSESITETSKVVAELSDAEKITAITFEDSVLTITYKDGTVNEYTIKESE